MTVIVGILALLAARAFQVRQARRRADRCRAEAVPDLVDLFALAAAAGHPVWTCLEVVADRAPPAVRTDVQRAVLDVGRGEPLGRALGTLGTDLGPEGRALTDALAVAVASGAPLVPALERVVDAARAARQRAAEERARRLPVALLFPLVGCILPAFALLAVVPLLAASIAALAR